MPDTRLTSLTQYLSTFRCLFTRPSFVNLLILFVGWTCCRDPTRAITGALVRTDVARQRHWQAFHRFFSRARWSTDRLGHWLFVLLRPMVWQQPWVFAADDSLCRKTGDFFGVGFHLEPVLSSRKYRNFVPAHDWVTVSVVLRVPWSSRPWAIPILYRLYRTKKTAGSAYKTKTALLREMLSVLQRWSGSTPCIFLWDSAYANKTVMAGLPSHWTVITSLRSNARFGAVPDLEPCSKRSRKRGPLLPKTQTWFHAQQAWQTVQVQGYVQPRIQKACAHRVQWYSVLKTRVVQVVLAPATHGQRHRLYLCTNPTLPVETVLNLYALRWSQECWYRDAKQLLGWADSSARCEQAVLHTAPWVGWLSGVLVRWYHDLYQGVEFPCRPWYDWKTNHSFADVLRTAQDVLNREMGDVLRWAEQVTWSIEGAPPSPRARHQPPSPQAKALRQENQEQKTPKMTPAKAA